MCVFSNKGALVSSFYARDETCVSLKQFKDALASSFLVILNPLLKGFFIIDKLRDLWQGQTYVFNALGIRDICTKGETKGESCNAQ